MFAPKPLTVKPLLPFKDAAGHFLPGRLPHVGMLDMRLRCYVRMFIFKRMPVIGGDGLRRFRDELQCLGV